MHRRLRLLPLFVAATCAATPGITRAADLMEVYSMARSADPVLAQAEAQLQQVEEGVVQSRAPLLPQLSAGLTFSQSGHASDVIVTGNGETLALGHGRNRSLSGSLSQTIVDFGQYANLAASHDRADAQQALYRAAEQQLLTRVAQAYFDALSAEDALEFAHARERALARQLDQAEKRYEVGLSAVTDVNEAKANHDAATADAINAKNALDNAYEVLAQIIGKPVHDLASLQEELPMALPEPADLASWVDAAQAHNPQLIAQQFQLEAAKHGISAARAGRLPTLDAHVSYSRGDSWTQYGPPMLDDDGGASISLTLSVPIFSGFATRSRVRQSIYRREESRFALEQLRRSVVANTRSAYRAVIAGVSEVEARRQAVLSAQSALDATQAGFEVGTRNIVDVLNSQQQLFQARSAYSRARHQFVLNKLLLEQSAGSIDIHDLEAVNALLVDNPQAAPEAVPTAANPTPAPE